MPLRSRYAITFHLLDDRFIIQEVVTNHCLLPSIAQAKEGDNLAESQASIKDGIDLGKSRDLAIIAVALDLHRAHDSIHSEMVNCSD